MKQQTRWHPDTCDCVIDFHWDDETPDEITLEHVATCNKHTGKSADEVHKEHQLENQMKANVS